MNPKEEATAKGGRQPSIHGKREGAKAKLIGKNHCIGATMGRIGGDTEGRKRTHEVPYLREEKA